LTLFDTEWGQLTSGFFFPRFPKPSRTIGMASIWLEILTYNFVMVGLTTIAALFVRRYRGVAAVVTAVIATILASAAVAVLIGRVALESLHLLCFGWFLHVPLVLLAAVIANWNSRRRWSIAGVSVIAVLLFIAFDAFLIEPNWLEVTTVQVQSDKVTRPWRLVLIADLQTDKLDAYERRVFDRVARARPDLVLMAGDYLQIRSEQFPRLRHELNAFLKSIDFRAPAGIYAVAGNAETRGWSQIFAGLPVTCMVNSTQCDIDELRLIGLSLRDSFDTRLRIRGDSQFQIVFGHGPDFALGEVEADLLLAGHTHGGQVQLPFLGPLITLSEVPRKWASGVTQIDSRRTLIVSRGIGMERMGAPRLRFLCRPELVIVDIQPAAKVSTRPTQRTMGR
jgi:predicted MPP superfamily phosphohydrolase